MYEKKLRPRNIEPDTFANISVIECFLEDKIVRLGTSSIGSNLRLSESTSLMWHQSLGSEQKEPSGDSKISG